YYETTTVAGEEVRAFVPSPLPPESPPVGLDDSLQQALEMATAALADLELAGGMVPSVSWFLYSFVRKEAVLTSQIEGTQATLVDLLSSEAVDETVGPDPDIEEVTNYLDALAWSRNQLSRPDGLPISARLLSEAHIQLMQGVRGSDKQPGEVRRSQNWVGGTRPGNAAFVPPPPHLLSQALSALERYIHADHELPPLIRIGLIHVQFETLHPYLDGNGRLGRLLIALLLEDWGLLREPLLYISLFLKRHRMEYYRRLDAVRTAGEWEPWLQFYLDGVASIATEAVAAIRDLGEQVESDRIRLLALKEATVPAVRLFELLPEHPVVTVTRVVKLLDTTRPTAGKAISALEEAGILKEITGRKRDRTWHYGKYIEILREGTE
ncbi:MAG: Fic family protein, partial [Acidobacteria bacterium]|nr:Fic family protein [Candidatus Polarisedimenticola svalbardensis]